MNNAYGKWTNAYGNDNVYGSIGRSCGDSNRRPQVGYLPVGFPLVGQTFLSAAVNLARSADKNVHPTALVLSGPPMSNRYAGQ
jgi:hypothetical protein